MPLIKSKSKKAFEHNMEAEMQAGKPQKQALAIAYNVKRKPKKMAKGGYPDPVKATEVIADKGYGKIIRTGMAEGGPVPQSQDGWTDQPTLPQARKGMKTTPIKHPKMVPSKGFSAKLRSQEDHLEMAEGGMINEEIPMSKAEEDEVQHPAGLEQDNDEMSPSKEEIMADHFAEGGMAHEMDMQPIDEEEMEHYDSLAAAVMAKRKKMAEGGRVDIDENAEEQPNMYDSQNEAILKENYDSDMDDVSQPMDSNEHGHELSDEDAHDMISRIRSKMAMKRHFR